MGLVPLSTIRLHGWGEKQESVFSCCFGGIGVLHQLVHTIGVNAKHGNANRGADAGIRLLKACRELDGCNHSFSQMRHFLLVCRVLKQQNKLVSTQARHRVSGSQSV
jgi:hypothetical protein